MWKIFFVMWVSWSWKWTLIKNLKNVKNEKFYFPLSYKTRQIRENEVNWIDGYFVSKEELFRDIQDWKFLEYALIHETDYSGTKFEDVIDKWINLWKIVIKEIDINWLEELRKNHPEMDEKYKTVFLEIPVEILKERIEKRWAFMTNEELERRINSAIVETQKSEELCDYIIDATKTEEEILKEFLEIIEKN